MATRSVIAMATDKGFSAIYCHWDGYPEYVGAILSKHYTDAEKVQSLMAMGDMSVLGIDIGPTDRPLTKEEREAHSETDPHKFAYCTFYGRDRDEELSKAETYSHMHLRGFADHCGAEWLYVYANGAWETHKI
jgi:hypothetical protein